MSAGTNKRKLSIRITKTPFLENTKQTGIYYVTRETLEFKGTVMQII